MAPSVSGSGGASAAEAFVVLALKNRKAANRSLRTD
jgi:hypothetical protein